MQACKKTVPESGGCWHQLPELQSVKQSVNQSPLHTRLIVEKAAACTLPYSVGCAAESLLALRYGAHTSVCLQRQTRVSTSHISNTSH